MTDFDTSLTQGTSYEFPMNGATQFTRLRAKRIPSIYNPQQSSLTWDNPDTLTFTGALAASTSSRTVDYLDERFTSTAVLTVADPNIDIQVGDRIRSTPDDGRIWQVTGFPSRDVNAFTGWQPTTEINLTEWKG